MASTEITKRFAPIWAPDDVGVCGPFCIGRSGLWTGLRRVLIQIDGRVYRDDFARIIVAASAAHVVRALQLATVRAIGRVASHKGVMRAAHVATGFGGAILRDSHVLTFGSGDRPLILQHFSRTSRQGRAGEKPMNEARTIAGFARGASPKALCTGSGSPDQMQNATYPTPGLSWFAVKLLKAVEILPE